MLPIYNCLSSHDATALKRRNINRKLGKVTLLVGDHNTIFWWFFFFLVTQLFNNTLLDLMKKTRVASMIRKKATDIYTATLLPDFDSMAQCRDRLVSDTSPHPLRVGSQLSVCAPASNSPLHAAKVLTFALCFSPRIAWRKEERRRRQQSGEEAICVGELVLGRRPRALETRTNLSVHMDGDKQKKRERPNITAVTTNAQKSSGPYCAGSTSSQ